MAIIYPPILENLEINGGENSEKEALVQAKDFLKMQEAHECLRKEGRDEWRKAECIYR